MNWIYIAAVGDFLVALLHMIIIFFLGAKGYRMFGAGEKFAQMAEAGKLYPHIVTFFIAIVFTLFGLYTLELNTVNSTYPYLREVNWAITIIYCGRGLAGIPIYFSGYENKTLMVWSSIVSLTLGMFHLMSIL